MNSETLNQFFLNHSLAKPMRRLKVDIVMERYSNWLKSVPSETSWHHALYRFAEENPFYHINKKAIEDILGVLNKNPQDTINVLNGKDREISRAIFSLIRQL